MNGITLVKTTLLFSLLCVFFSGCGQALSSKASAIPEDNKPSRDRYENFDEFQLAETEKGEGAATVHYYSLVLFTYTCAHRLIDWFGDTYGEPKIDIVNLVWTAPRLETLYDKPLQISLFLDSMRVGFDQPEYYVMSFDLNDLEGNPITFTEKEILPYRDYFQWKLEQLKCATNR